MSEELCDAARLGYSVNCLEVSEAKLIVERREEKMDTHTYTQIDRKFVDTQ